jgi:hypothetical protein
MHKFDGYCQFRCPLVVKQAIKLEDPSRQFAPDFLESRKESTKSEIKKSLASISQNNVSGSKCDETPKKVRKISSILYREN